MRGLQVLILALLTGCASPYVLEGQRQSIAKCPRCGWTVEQIGRDTIGDGTKRKVVVNHVRCYSLWCLTETAYTNVYVMGQPKKQAVFALPPVRIQNTSNNPPVFFPYNP